MKVPMVNQQKLDFLKNNFINKLRQLKANQQGKWGVLKGQEMVEHFIDAVQMANGKVVYQLVTAPDMVDKMQAFMMSDKPFKENTPNSLMSTTPPPLIYPNISDAIDQLKIEISLFEKVYLANEQLKITNPFFGDLNFEQYTQLLHKHAMHHLLQFELVD